MFVLGEEVTYSTITAAFVFWFSSSLVMHVMFLCLCVNIAVERVSGDPNTTQTEEETTVTDQETPGTSSQVQQRTSTSVISPERATQTQEDPGATVQTTQGEESVSTEQEWSSTDI